MLAGAVVQQAEQARRVVVAEAEAAREDGRDHLRELVGAGRREAGARRRKSSMASSSSPVRGTRWGRPRSSAGVGGGLEAERAGDGVPLLRR